MYNLPQLIKSRINNFLLEHNSSIKLIPVKKLYTSNRKDVELRIKFLEDVIKKNEKIESTQYYWFIGDEKRWAQRNPEISCKDFLQLYENIKANGLNMPIDACSVNSKKITIKDKTHDKKKKIESTYQLQDGAHRLAIYEFLGKEKIPCRIYRPLPKKTYPDYTTYIKKRSDYYNEMTNGTHS